MELVTTEVKKGLRNPLDEAQVRKAVVALQTFLEKQRSAEKKKELLSSTEYLSCIITRKTIPSKASLKPLTIDVPHSLYGGENDAEMCLFVKDSDKERIKKALEEDPVAGLTKVMTLKKLRKNFKQFEDRRTLADSYDMFLADDRILPYLKTPLGTKFFVKKKQPISVRVSRKDVSNSIRSVFHRTAMHVSAGACTNVKIAHFGMSIDEIVDNIMVGMNNCASNIPKNWSGIQSISVKSNDSIALPIYNALSDLAKLPPVSSKKVLLKRKLEDVEPKDAVSGDSSSQPVAKKQKDVTPTKSSKNSDSTPNKKSTHSKDTPSKKSTPSKDTTSTKSTPSKDTPSKKSTSVKDTPAKPKVNSTKSSDSVSNTQRETPQKTTNTTPSKSSSNKNRTQTPTPTKKGKRGTPAKK